MYIIFIYIHVYKTRESSTRTGSRGVAQLMHCELLQASTAPRVADLARYRLRKSGLMDGPVLMVIA